MTALSAQQTDVVRALALRAFVVIERNKVAILLCLAAIAMLIFSPSAFAQTGELPWEKAICTVAKSMSGTTAKAIAVIAVVVCGLLLAFGEMNGIFKTFLGLLMGVSMALMAASWVGVIGGDSSFCGITSL